MQLRSHAPHNSLTFDSSDIQVIELSLQGKTSIEYKYTLRTLCRTVDVTIELFCFDYLYQSVLSPRRCLRYWPLLNFHSERHELAEFPNL